MMNVQKGNEAAHEGDRPINKNKRWKLPMKKTRRTLTMILVLAIFLSFALPSGRIYADFENEEETVEETAPAAPAVIRSNAPAVVTEIAAENTARSAGNEGAGIAALSAYRPAANTVEILDGELPMAAPVASAASLHGWALINLICALLSLYILLPLLGMKRKFARVSELQSRESNELSEEESRYLRRFTLGLTVEILAGILAVVIIALTQDLGSRMLLVDGYTPLMAALAAVCGTVDFAARKENGVETAKA